MWIPVYSRLFFQQLQRFTETRRQDIEKAVSRVLTNPTLPGYQRPYLSPYCQEHPSDKTLTLFFEVLAPCRFFFVWVNDDRFPHNTRKKHKDDPCVKEFLRLKSTGGLEAYSKKFHEGEFIVKPRGPKAPKFVSFEKYDVKVFANITHDGNTHYVMAANDDAARPGDLHDHYPRFFEGLREHFLDINEPFELRAVDMEFARLVGNSVDPAQWNQVGDPTDPVWIPRK